MHPYHHSLSSSKRFGGVWTDYIKIHNWFDETKSTFHDMRHRALRHHSEGIFWCEEAFGVTITNSDGKEIPVRQIGEQHVLEDLGFIPNVKDYLECLDIKSISWINKGSSSRKLMKDLNDIS